MTFNTGSVTGLWYLLECRHRIRGDLLRWEGLGAQSVPQVTPFRFIFHWKTVALYIKKISCPFPSEPLFFHVWVVEEYEEPMQYHLKSSCSSGEVKVQIQACTQWPGGNWYSNGQVNIVLVKNGLQSISSWIEGKSVRKSWKKSEMQLFANTKLVKNKYFTYIWPPKEVANLRKGEMPLCSRTD